MFKSKTTFERDFIPGYRRYRRYSGYAKRARDAIAGAKMRVPRSIRNAPAANSHMLSPLAAGVIAPFHPRVAGKVSAGDVQSTPTVKVSAKVQAVLTCNSSGYAQALITPTTANDRPCLQISTQNANLGATFGRPINANDTSFPPANYQDFYHNGPYTYAQLSQQASDNGASGGESYNMESRLNLIGIRITPTGPVLDRSGTLYIVRPSHGVDVSFIQVANYTNEPNTQMVSVSQMPYNYEYCAAPFNAEDTEMSSDPWNWVSDSTSTYYDTASQQQYGRAGMIGIKVSGCAANFTFRLELVFHMEYSGLSLASISTPTCADDQGTQNALALASDINKTQQADTTVHRSVAAETSHAARAAAGPLSIAAQAGVPGASAALSVDQLLSSKQGSTAVAVAAKAATAISKKLKLRL